MSAAALLRDIVACRACAAHLPHGPRPIVQFSTTARLLIVGQAPGRKAHDSGMPWNDASGDRLREWTGLDRETFYDPARVALMGMGLCYPGKGPSADLPPRPECAPLWHDRILAVLPPARLTLLVGSHAQAQFLPTARHLSLTERVRHFERFAPDIFPLPHPSWRSTGWMQRNPWFEADVLPALRAAVGRALTG